MNPFTFNTSKSIRFGSGIVNQLGEMVAGEIGGRVMLVTDPGMVATGLVERALDALNTRWMSHLNGRMDMGHIAVGCALGYLDLRHDERSWRTGRDSLAQWFETFSKRDSMVATKPQP